MALDLGTIVLVPGVGDGQLRELERFAASVSSSSAGIRSPSHPNPPLPRSAASSSIESASSVR